MSSSVDSGYCADEASKEKDEKCSKGGKHIWKKHGLWASTWEECKKCGKTIFWK